ncbi:hypothetical protein SB96558_5511, partial [Shigella boydii 965-58]
MPYEIPTLGKLIADGEKDIAYELGLQKLPPVSVEQALNVSFSSQVRDLYDHQSWIKDQIIPSPRLMMKPLSKQQSMKALSASRPPLPAGG